MPKTGFSGVDDFGTNQELKQTAKKSDETTASTINFPRLTNRGFALRTITSFTTQR